MNFKDYSVKIKGYYTACLITYGSQLTVVDYRILNRELEVVNDRTIRGIYDNDKELKATIRRYIMEDIAEDMKKRGSL